MNEDPKLELSRIVFENHYQSVLSGIESCQKFRDHLIATVSCGGIALSFAIIDKLYFGKARWLVWFYLIPILCWAVNIVLLVWSAEYSRKAGCTMADILGSGRVTQEGVEKTNAYNTKTRKLNIINAVMLIVGLISFAIILVASISSGGEVQDGGNLRDTDLRNQKAQNVITITDSCLYNSTIFKCCPNE